MSVTSVTFQTMADSNQEEENEEYFAIHGNDDTRGQKKKLLRTDCTDDFSSWDVAFIRAKSARSDFPRPRIFLDDVAWGNLTYDTMRQKIRPNLFRNQP